MNIEAELSDVAVMTAYFFSRRVGREGPAVFDSFQSQKRNKGRSVPSCQM
jgi:hypothetical protein